ncbi:unnamed protein product [Xylocopa violacea]|uniref:Secreted protein n=1 Tax=Xylocopa violacea TaxID=135666 RepID=A0ABP1NKJ7_XYLVO
MFVLNRVPYFLLTVRFSGLRDSGVLVLPFPVRFSVLCESPDESASLSLSVGSIKDGGAESPMHFARECVTSPIWNGAPVLPVRPLRSVSFGEESIESPAGLAREVTSPTTIDDKISSLKYP